MIQTIDFNAFCEAFKSHGRQDNFSYAGKRVLFDYIESLEEDTDTPQELDVIALCCEFIEDNVNSIASDYGIDIDDIDEDSDDKEGDIVDCVVDYLREYTTVCGIVNANSIIYQQF